MHEELLETAVAAARAGAEVLGRYFGSQSLEFEAKAENDLVTIADRESEAAVVARIRASYPDHDILTEEAGRLGSGEAEHQWVIDPLDGTSNFLQGLPIFAVSIACRRRGETVAACILDPAAGRLYTATRGGGAWLDGRPMRVSSRPGTAGSFLATGFPFKALAALDAYLEIFRDAFADARSIRRCGSAALDLANTAAGVYDGFFEFRLAPWDIAAGALMIEEAGGRVSDLDGGDRYLGTGNLVAGAPGVHRELLAKARRHASEALLDQLVPVSAVVAGGSC